eukprot:8962884-Pyramimonas_sp.AAC.1
MKAILSYDISTDRLDSLPEKLVGFEDIAQQSDDFVNQEECSDDVKTTAVIQTIPEPRKGQIELSTDLHETYEGLEQNSRAHVQGKRDWKTFSPKQEAIPGLRPP